MTIRTARPGDIEEFSTWSFSTPDNGLDPRVATYPHLNTFVVEQNGQPLLYAPTHPVLAIESVAVNPSITPRQYIEALLEVKRTTEDFARRYGIREIYTSSAYKPMVRTLCRHGYTPIVGTALRKRIE